MLRTALATVLLLSGIKLLGVPAASWILAGGLGALGAGLAAYAVRAWLARPRVRPSIERV
jgi:hypothetical protein